MQAFGYTTETMQFMLEPMITELRDPLGSMGNDAALAVMSDKPRMLYDYFKQRFAQVTNPAIDSIREEVIMALECYIGPEQNLLETTAEHAHRLRIPHPILTNDELAAVQQMDHRGWRAKTIDITYAAGSGRDGLVEALTRINTEASQAIAEGYSLVVLSDRNVSQDRVAITSLLAVGSVHQHLIRESARTRIGLVLESGEAREVHHHWSAGRFRRRRHQPLSGIRESMAGAGTGPVRRHPPCECRRRHHRRLSQGDRQGHAQGHGQNGHLHAAVL